MEKVLYHQDGQEPRLLFVLETLADKTVNIGLEDGTVKVARCQVLPVPTPGACTRSAANDALAKVAKSMRGKADGLKKKADDALAASAAKPDDATLKEAAEKARSVYEKAEGEATAAEAQLEVS